MTGPPKPEQRTSGGEMDEDERKPVVFESDEAKRRALIAWMGRVDLGEVFLGVMRDRQVSRELGYEVRGWSAMRERWQGEADR